MREAGSGAEVAMGGVKRGSGVKPAVGATPVELPAGASRFRARLEPDGTELKWTIVHVPAGVVEGWTAMRRMRVRCEVNGVGFRTSLFPRRDGRPGTFVLVNKQVQRAAGVGVGEKVEVRLAPDLEERPAALPAELVRAFEGDRALRRWAEALSESMRREIGKWIGAVKGPEAQQRRSRQMAERLLLTMEGEQSLPPVLEAALAQRSGARQAWEAMTVVQRRGHLLGIFNYQTPEARARRAVKAVEEALRAGRGRTTRTVGAESVRD